MSKITLIEDSHSLSNWCHCEQLYQYTNVLKIKPRLEKDAFYRGRIIATLLEKYYNAKIAMELTRTKLLDIVNEVLVPSTLEQAEKDLIEMRFYNYWKYYQTESWIPIAAEINAAFSKILYEDDDYLFIYEGRPDLIVQLNRNDKVLLVVDHKHQSRRTDIYPHVNQPLGYTWGIGTGFFVYNYFSIIESGKPSDWFRRSTHTFKKEDIEDWKQTTIKRFFQIAKAQEFLKSYQCDGKYGVCTYHSLCEEPLVNIRQSKMEREFKVEEHRAW